MSPAHRTDVCATILALHRLRHAGVQVSLEDELALRSILLRAADRGIRVRLRIVRDQAVSRRPILSRLLAAVCLAAVCLGLAYAAHLVVR